MRPRLEPVIEGLATSRPVREAIARSRQAKEDRDASLRPALGAALITRSRCGARGSILRGQRRRSFGAGRRQRPALVLHVRGSCLMGHRDRGVEPCTTERPGEPCSPEGARCDPGNSCNQDVVCAATDPTMNPGGCPISKREFKDAIRYLTPEDRKRIHDELVAFRLATSDSARRAPTESGTSASSSTTSDRARPSSPTEAWSISTATRAWRSPRSSSRRRRSTS